jgi:hypothetical protein
MTANVAGNPAGDTEPGSITGDRTIPAIALLCMQQLNENTRFTTNALISSYQEENRELRALLAAIRAGVSNALNQPWMPVPDLIAHRLFPPEEIVRQFMPPAEEPWNTSNTGPSVWDLDLNYYFRRNDE